MSKQTIIILVVVTGGLVLLVLALQKKTVSPAVYPVQAATYAAQLTVNSGKPVGTIYQTPGVSLPSNSVNLGIDLLSIQNAQEATGVAPPSIVTGGAGPDEVPLDYSGSLATATA